MKRGTIITLHKGGRKSKKDPNNYRAITLTSAVLKLFERLILDKLYDSLEKPFNSMQGGFRPATGCNMSSLMLKECVSFAKEHDSKLFACFLDIHKAFDKVWHNGLFVKLYNMGIRSKLLKIVINLHSNVESSVFHCGFFSNAFPVLQGTRQGGVISPFMYLCYIDDLLDELIACDVGFKMANVKLACPTVCDDMLLLALSRLGLQILMNISYRYSCLWRIEFSAPKCFVVVFNELRSYFHKHHRSWFLGPNEIKEDENYKHLGVNCNKYLKLNANIKDCTDKLKGTFMGIANCGLFSDLNPLSCIKLYKSVVLPKALYGCESWSNLSENGITQLERAHRFCIKYMQGFGIRTRTDIALGLLGVFPLESEIDFKKLNLLGQLCRSDTKCWITPVFHIRLESYLNNRNKQIGFFCDITRLLEKYGLAAYLENFRNHGTFPCKTAWNKLVKEKIRQYETVQWHNRISVAEFSLFTRLHDVLQPHIFWYRSKENPKISHCYKSLMQIITYLCNNFNGSLICTYCKREYSNLVMHCIHECGYLDLERMMMVTSIQLFNANIYYFLCRLDKTSQTLILLGENNATIHAYLDTDASSFYDVCAVSLHRMWSKMYKNRLR